MKITPRYGGSTKIQIEANSGSAIFGTHYIMSGWDEGSFFIKNLYNGDYLTEPGGNSNTELRLITLPSDTNKEYTLWNMHYYADGYYQLTQDISINDCVYGYNTTSTSICGMPWASTPYQQTLWKFIPIGDGMFKIQNQYHETNNPNYFISLNNTATKDICFLSNSGVKMLWDIKPMKFNINVLFDQAFIDRHTVYGYQSVLNTVFGSNQNCSSIISNLLTRLGIHASYNVVSTAFNTYESYPYTTDCELLGSSDFSEFCYNDQEYEPYNCDNQDHSTEDNDCLAGYHHKNGNRILGEMQTISRLSSTNARILFTGFNCCNYDYNNHVHTPSSYVISGWAYGEATKCLIMPCQDMKRVAQHELVHILGAPDCGTGNTNNCIMGHNQLNEDVVSEMVICPSCFETIKLLKYSFYNH